MAEKRRKATCVQATRNFSFWTQPSVRGSQAGCLAALEFHVIQFQEIITI